MITKDMYLNDVLEMDQGVVPIFFDHGLHCLGCILAAHETIEQASVVHGISLDNLLRDLNDYFEEHPVQEKTADIAE